MNIINFTPISAIIGGMIIGLAVVIFFLFNGRLVGISGIAANALSEKKNKFDNFKNFSTISKDLRTDWYYDKYDFVWSSEVIEHLFDDQNFFKKLVNSTKRDGYTMITTPYYNSYLNFAKKYNWSLKPSKEEVTGHVRLGYNEEDLKNILGL